MAHFGKDPESFSAAGTVQIIGSETNENFTLYNIEVTVGMYTWTVQHRYSEFHEVHEKLVSGYKVDKSLLPPKKVFGKQAGRFVKKRQQDLEVYLQTVVQQLAHQLPLPLVVFLHFHLYEIHGITQTMAEDLYNRGEMLLLSNNVYEVTPLQLYSLTERLKLPEPTCDSGDVRKDLGHILDFITRTKHLKICGSEEKVGSSNINMNLLQFDLSLFKALRSLEVVKCNFYMVHGLETIKHTLNMLEVHQSATTIKEIVLQDVPLWKAEDGTQLVGGWDHVRQANFSHNAIKEIDSCVQMMWRVSTVNLSHNQLEGVQHLQLLSHMTHLLLSHNRLRVLDSLHTKLGNLKCLILNGNLIESLQGFSKLFSLEILDVSDNKISKVEDVRPVCQLPCLECLNLTDNTVTTAVDYRTRILEMFGDRVSEVSLDNEKASQKEQDKVAVRQAIQKARDAKAKQTAPRKNSSAASLSDVYGNSRGETPPPSNDDSLPPSGCPSLHNTSEQSHEVNDSHTSCSGSLQQCQQPSNHSVGSIFVPGSNSCQKGGHLSNTHSQDCVKAVDRRVLIPEAHPFDHSAEAVPHPSINRVNYKVADLPTLDCQSFVSWLEKHVPVDDSPCDCPAPCRNERGGCLALESSQVVDVMWCYCQTYSTQASVLPCCAILTTSKLFIQTLSPLPVSCDIPYIPQLHLHLALPLNSIQHVVVGPCYAYIRVEEAFVGTGGLFTLFALERSVMKRFSEALQDCCTELDPNSPLDILDLLCQSDLLTKVCHREKDVGVMSDYLLFTLLVRVEEKDEVRTCVLVMSKNAVYCVDVSCVYWPPATFQSTHELASQITILEEFSIRNHIVDITPCLRDKISNDSANRADFAPVAADVHIHCDSQDRHLIFMFSTSTSLDTFLDLVNSLRSQQTLQCVPQHVDPVVEGSCNVMEHTDSSSIKCDTDVNSSDSVSVQKAVVPLAKTGAHINADLVVLSETNQKENCVEVDTDADISILSEHDLKEKSIDPAVSAVLDGVPLNNTETDSHQFLSCNSAMEKVATSLVAGKTDQQNNNAVHVKSDIESENTASDSQSKDKLSDSQCKGIASDSQSKNTGSDNHSEDKESDSQSKNTVSDSQTKDIVSDSQSKDTVSDSRSKNTGSDSHSEDTVSDNQTKDTVSDSHTKDTVSDIQTKDTVSGSPSKDTVSDIASRDAVSDIASRDTVPDCQSKDTVSDSQSKDAVSDSQSKNTVSDSQNKDTVSDSQTTDTVSDSQSKNTGSDSHSEDTVSNSQSKDKVSNVVSRDTVSDAASKDTESDSHTKDTVSNSQSKDTVSDIASRDTVSDIASRDTVSDSQSKGRGSDSHFEDTVFDSQSKNTESDSHSEDTESDSQSKHTLSDSQSKNTLSDSQFKDIVSDSQLKDIVSDSQSKGTVSDSQSKNSV